MVKIGLIGDVHNSFDKADVAYFNQSDLDLLLFVGDLAEYREKEGIATAKIISQISKPALLIPGNHDTITAVQLLSEIKWSQSWRNRMGRGQGKRVARFHDALRPVVVGGYSTHPFQFDDVTFDIVVGRPYTMGGPKLNFIPQLKRQFNVANMEDSITKLKQCVDQCQSENILFLAHNGPTGLGTQRDDIWGCDFWEEAGDFGDPDLAQAISYAQSSGKSILGVFAGHMHHQLKGGGLRKWFIEQDGVTYLNAGNVPRIYEENGRIHHHYIELLLNQNHLSYVERTFPPEIS